MFGFRAEIRAQTHADGAGDNFGEDHRVGCAEGGERGGEERAEGEDEVVSDEEGVLKRGTPSLLKVGKVWASEARSEKPALLGMPS